MTRTTWCRSSGAMSWCELLRRSVPAQPEAHVAYGSDTLGILTLRSRPMHENGANSMDCVIVATCIGAIETTWLFSAPIRSRAKGVVPTCVSL